MEQVRQPRHPRVRTRRPIAALVLAFLIATLGRAQNPPMRPAPAILALLDEAFAEYRKNTAESYVRAREILQRARRLARELEDNRGEAMAARGIVRVYMDEGRFKEAKESARLVLEAARAADMTPFEVYGLGDQALACIAQEEYEEAFLLAHQAYRLTRSRESTGRDRVFAALVLGTLYNRLGQPQSALLYLQEAVDLSEQHRLRGEGLRSNREMGFSYSSTGEMEKALECLNLAFRLAESDPGASILDIRLNIADIHLKRGEYEIARVQAQRAMELAGRLRHRESIYEAYSRLAEAAVGRDDDSAAEAGFRKVAESGTRAAFRGLVGLARIYEKRDELESAAAQYERAISSREDWIDARSADADRLGVALQIFDPFLRSVEVLVRLCSRSAEGDHSCARRAFAANERIHNRLFLDQLARAWTRKQRAPRELENRRDAIEQRLTSLSRTLLDRNVPPPVERNLRAALESLELERSEIEREIAIRNRQFEAGRRLEEPQVEQVQAALPRDTALVEYCFGAPAAAFVIAREQFDLVPLPRATALEERVPAYVHLLSTPSSSSAGSFETLAGEELYRDLLEPVLRKLPRTVSHLMISPSEPLETLPFAALPTGGGSPLIKQFAVSYIPSAGTMTLIRSRGNRPGPGPLLAFADPDYGDISAPSPTRGFIEEGDFVLGPLPQTRSEVESVAGIFGRESAHVFTGKDATEARLKTMDLRPFRVLHFAMHSLVSPTHPDRTALVFAQGTDSKEDGILQVREIYDLRLDADLVVLSACRTGEVTGGRESGIRGLSHAFALAGARSLVASLWKVEDTATALLMTRFYDYLRQGMSKAESLRRAELDLVERERMHPRQWAAFVLFGEATGLVPMPPRPPAWSSWIFLVFPGTLLAAAFLFAWRKRGKRRAEDATDLAVRQAMALQPVSVESCVSADELMAFYSDQLLDPRREQIRNHLATCAACLELARDLCLYLDARPAPAQQAGSTGWPLLRSRAWQAAAVSLAVLALGGLWWIQHARRQDERMRGIPAVQSIQLKAPKGFLKVRPSVLEWHPILSADRYEVEIRDTRLNLVWRAAEVRTTRIEIPEDVIRRLEAGEYAWRVTAVSRDGRSTMSPFETFQIAGK